MMNLKHIQEHPHWRVAVLATVAKLMGVCIHVEGIPFGSSRKRKPPVGKYMDGPSGARTPTKIRLATHDGDTSR